MDVVRLLYQPLARVAAHRVLIGRRRSREAADQGRFTRGDVNELLKNAWARYCEEVGSLPRQSTVGRAMNIRLACFTMSFFDALLARGNERA